MDNQMTELIDRVSRLETQNRFFKRIAGVTLAVLAVVIFGGAYGFNQNNKNTLKVQHAVVVDNALKAERISLKHTLDGSWLEMKDLSGRTRVKIGTGPLPDEKGLFELLDKNGNSKDFVSF